MKLTPKQREFLQIAARTGTEIVRSDSGQWIAYTEEKAYHLRERWGDDLRLASLIEVDQNDPGKSWRRHYRITDAGRKAIE